MPVLFVHLLTRVYTIWHQNGNIPKRVSRDVITLIKKDPDKSDKIRYLRPITLLNTDLKNLAKVLAKRLARVLRGLVREAQTCAIPTRCIHNNLRLVRYSLERVGQTSGKDGTLEHLDQSKAFDNVNQEDLLAFLEAAVLSLNVRS